MHDGSIEKDDARGKKPKERTKQGSPHHLMIQNNGLCPFTPKAATQAVIFDWCAADIVAISSISRRSIMKSLKRI